MYVAGLLGISRATGEVGFDLYSGLSTLQHRGQQAVGIAVYDGVRGHTVTGNGLLEEAVKKASLDSLSGTTGVGWVASAASVPNRPAPNRHGVASTKHGAIAFALDGQVASAQFPATATEQTFVDSLVEHLQGTTVVDAIGRAMNQVPKKFSLVCSVNDSIVAVRDPFGMRPLWLGELEDGYVLASESATLQILDARNVRPLHPGEAVLLGGGNLKQSRQLFEPTPGRRMTEVLSTARFDSNIGGKSVYEIHRTLGELLHRQRGVPTDVLTSLSERGRGATMGYATAADATARTLFHRNRYTCRSHVERPACGHPTINVIDRDLDGATVTIVEPFANVNELNLATRLLRDRGVGDVHVRLLAPTRRDAEVADANPEIDRWPTNDLSTVLDATSVETLPLPVLNGALPDVRSVPRRESAHYDEPGDYLNVSNNE